MKLVAKNDRVIIKPTEKSETMYNGIIIPDLGKEKPEMGVIVSVGPGVLSTTTGELIPTTLKVGETILVPKFGASQITIDGEEYYITREIEVIASLEEDDADEPFNIDEESLEEKSDWKTCGCGNDEVCAECIPF